MKLLVTKWFGTFLLEGETVVARKDFPRTAEAVAERLLKIRQGKILEEERALASEGILVIEHRLRSLGGLHTLDKPLTIEPVEPGLEILREAALRVARDASRRASGERDRFVVQSVRALDEVTRTVNTLMERLRDWYALHYPEALRKVADPAKLAKALAEDPARAGMAVRLGTLAPEASIGAEFDEHELAAIRSFAQQLVGLFAERDRLEALIQTEARAVAPTLCGVVGPVIGARLISHANGLEKLAMVPTSTIQTYGAENALFLHLKEGKKPPKHGVLFQHPLVNTAPWWQRGRISRLLAASACHAARLDHFSPTGGDRSAPIKAAFEADLARLRERAKTPKPRSDAGRGGARRPPMRAFAPRAPRPSPGRPRGGRPR